MKKILLMFFMVSFIQISSMEMPESKVDLQLFDAVLMNDRELVELLMFTGANPHVKFTYYGRETTALQQAAKKAQIFEYMLKNGGNPALIDSLFCEVLMRRTLFTDPVLQLQYDANRAIIIQLLLNDNRTNLSCSMDDITPLKFAVTNQDIPLIQKLLATNRVNINAEDASGLTALDYAKSKQIRDFLIANGALPGSRRRKQPSKPEVIHATPMAAAWHQETKFVVPQKSLEQRYWEAVKSQDVERLRIVFGERENNFVNDYDIVTKKTPLMIAAGTNSVPLASFLLKNQNLKVNLQDGEGNSALAIAVHLGHKEIVQLLLNDTRTKLNQINKLYLTPLDIALSKSVGVWPEIANLLRVRGAKKAEELKFNRPAPQETTTFETAVYAKLGLQSQATPAQILGVEINASLADVKTAYRKKSLIWHPDRNKDPLATQVFALLNWAYEQLLKTAK